MNVITRRNLMALIATAAIAPLTGCSEDEIPANTSEEEYSVGCEALDLIDEALAKNELFSDEFKTKLSTICVKARDANNHDCSNDEEIMYSIQCVAAYLALNNGDDALDAIDDLRYALGKEDY